MVVVEVLGWILAGLVLGSLATFLPHDRHHNAWLIFGSGLFAWLGGTLGKFVIKVPTNVDGELSWLSIVLALAGAVLFIWYHLMIGHTRVTRR